MGTFMPEWLDFFGIPIFIFIFWVGLKFEKKLPGWVSGALMSIGILGIAVDGAIVLQMLLE